MASDSLSPSMRNAALLAMRICWLCSTTMPSLAFSNTSRYRASLSARLADTRSSTAITAPSVINWNSTTTRAKVAVFTGVGVISSVTPKTAVPDSKARINATSAPNAALTHSTYMPRLRASPSRESTMNTIVPPCQAITRLTHSGRQRWLSISATTTTAIASVGSHSHAGCTARPRKRNVATPSSSRLNESDRLAATTLNQSEPMSRNRYSA